MLLLILIKPQLDFSVNFSQICPNSIKVHFLRLEEIKNIWSAASGNYHYNWSVLFSPRRVASDLI